MRRCRPARRPRRRPDGARTPDATFADLVDRLSVLAARLSTEEFRRLICAMAQARQKR
jgi:hypothetical protein